MNREPLKMTAYMLLLFFFAAVMFSTLQFWTSFFMRSDPLTTAKQHCFTQNMMLVVKYHKDGKVDYDCAPLFPEFGNPKI